MTAARPTPAGGSIAGMELTETIRRRRMIRRYDPDRPVPDEVVRACVEAAIRAPSAGFSQGWDFLVLRSPAERDAFWSATTGDEPPDTWLAGMATAPALIVCLSDPDRYLDRYAEPDKGWTDRDPARWPVPYWDVDTGMAALVLLLAGVDAGLGGCFFGVPPARADAVREAFDIPADRNLVGVVSLGRPGADRPSPSVRRGRRPLSDVAHNGRFGAAWPG